MEDKNIFDVMDNGMMEYFIHADMSEIESMSMEDGVDLSKTEERRNKFAKKIKFLAQAKLKKYKDEDLLSKAFDMMQKMIQENVDKPISLLKRHIEERGIAFQFRSLDKLDEDDIKEILSELDLVKLMEDIEEEESDNQ